MCVCVFSLDSCVHMFMVQDVEERLREAEERLGRSRPEMAARQRELEVRRKYITIIHVH